MIFTAERIHLALVDRNCLEYRIPFADKLQQIRIRSSAGFPDKVNVNLGKSVWKLVYRVGTRCIAAYTTAMVRRRTKRLSSDIQLSAPLRYPDLEVS